MFKTNLYNTFSEVELLDQKVKVLVILVDIAKVFSIGVL